ncbi:MAG: bifunctional DNA-formamidopyrimidine glycosylase/DNA-(apurinic or apyrimidinic site) lyase [Nitriliruptoraceae bacterium]|nr:bifunctional DNA-formamidopyrimidine glycosylase/DNA-(apurinic or apyrimidinic site) lyase [Nitriliruptoraceae bacterium]
MPELPEVESVRRQLVPELTGRRIVDAWYDAHPHARLTEVALAVGHRIVEVRRRGKFLLLPLDDGPVSPARPLELVLHLGMTGSLSIGPTSTATGDPDAGLTHVRVRYDLDDGRTLRFRDPRRFGRASVVDADDYAATVPTLATLGPEPLTEAFDPEAFAAALARTSAPVKARLLDQRLVAGVGNIYADEALWRAGIHPASRRVGRTRAVALHRHLVTILEAAVEREGTTFRDYQMVNGASGRYADFLDAYGQAERPCRRCGTTMARTTVAGRGTTFCPSCQRH